jgi:Tfp pilus assembly protein PilX
MSRSMRRQRGTTLVIALIMLVLLTLFAVSSLNTSRTNLKVVGNMQQRNEALNAAQQTIEAVISTPQFIANPANAVPTPCGAANTMCTDVTGDGVADFTTTLTPQPGCVSVVPVKNANLNFSNPDDLGCAAGAAQGSTGVAGALTGDSLCSQTVWDIKAQTVSTTQNSTVTVTQGVGVRISSDDASASCP